jgi:hypothetical protein
VTKIYHKITTEQEFVNENENDKTGLTEELNATLKEN